MLELRCSRQRKQHLQRYRDEIKTSLLRTLKEIQYNWDKDSEWGIWRDETKR